MYLYYIMSKGPNCPKTPSVCADRQKVRFYRNSIFVQLQFRDNSGEFLFALLLGYHSVLFIYSKRSRRFRIHSAMTIVIQSIEAINMINML